MTGPVPVTPEPRARWHTARTATAATGRGSAHAKAILLGEHAAVYGAPALAVPLPQVACRATATPRPSGRRGLARLSCVPTLPGTGEDTAAWEEIPPGLAMLVDALLQHAAGAPQAVDVEFETGVPPGRGLGASAALARAVTRALDQLLGLDLSEAEVFDYVQLAETAAHGKASGIDALATGSIRPVLLSAGRASTPAVGRDAWIVVADSGTPGSTRQAVTMLQTHFDTSTPAREQFLTCSRVATGQALHALAHGHLHTVGSCLSDTHQLLAGLNLSTDRIDRLVGAALEAGALGAKMSGGGLGGCMVALSDSPTGAEALSYHLLQHGAAHTWTTRIEKGGAS
ncbi:mevalonate kinase [Streptomyces sp. NPDC056500]|uniref:mevalonate kinase n=1 Tax=Streptomyces sp. NPDC056500 TaxID=3345840 RepID=UPI00367771B7